MYGRQMGPTSKRRDAAAREPKVLAQESTAFRLGTGHSPAYALQVHPDMPDVLDVGFITHRGKTLLHRRYEENHCLPCQADIRDCDTWTEAYPDNDRIVLDGKTFVVWYERIAAFTFGLEPR